jgi:hypothetical protein
LLLHLLHHVVSLLLNDLNFARNSDPVLLG